MTDIWIELPSSIIYVAGTVNGAETVFRQDVLNYQRWRASVDAAPDGLYHISLEMYDEAENKGAYNQTIEYILPIFVHDRKQGDVDRALELQRIGWVNLSDGERQEWLAGMRGCLNKTDLKRIENDIHVIAQLLSLPLQSNKDNIPDIPDSLYFQTLLDNVQRIRDTEYLHNDTPPVPCQPLNTWQKWNDVERILHDIYDIYNDNNSRFFYCGTEIFTGETGLI